MCSLRCLPCNAHAPYCHLWPDPLYNIFPPYLINDTIFGEKNFGECKIRGLIFTTILSETFHITRRIQRVVAINVRRSSCKVPVVVIRF